MKLHLFMVLVIVFTRSDSSSGSGSNLPLLLYIYLSAFIPVDKKQFGSCVSSLFFFWWNYLHLKWAPPGFHFLLEALAAQDAANLALRFESHSDRPPPPSPPPMCNPPNQTQRLIDGATVHLLYNYYCKLPFTSLSQVQSAFGHLSWCHAGLSLAMEGCCWLSVHSMI